MQTLGVQKLTVYETALTPAYSILVLAMVNGTVAPAAMPRAMPPVKNASKLDSLLPCSPARLH